MEYVRGLLSEKDNISEQLVVLRKHKNNPDVQEYISKLENYEFLSGYMRYMIDRYYYGIRNTKKAKKNSIEKMFKIVLS